MPGTEDTVESPCIMVCQLHPKAQICLGCLRTRDEIASWSRADNAYKQHVLDQLEARKKLGTKLFRVEMSQT